MPVLRLGLAFPQPGPDDPNCPLRRAAAATANRPVRRNVNLSFFQHRQQWWCLYWRCPTCLELVSTLSRASRPPRGLPVKACLQCKLTLERSPKTLQFLAAGEMFVSGNRPAYLKLKKDVVCQRAFSEIFLLCHKLRRIMDAIAGYHKVQGIAFSPVTRCKKNDDAMSGDPRAEHLFRFLSTAGSGGRSAS
jgi:hypothetical protein